LIYKKGDTVNLLKSIFISGIMMLIAALTFTALLMILQGGNTLGWLGGFIEFSTVYALARLADDNPKRRPEPEVFLDVLRNNQVVTTS